MKTIILIFVCMLLSVTPSSVFAEASTDRQAAEKQQQLSDPNQQMGKIEKYIARLHWGTENYYANQLIEVKQRAEAEIALLEVTDRAVCDNLIGQAEVAKTILHIDNYGYRAPWYLEEETEKMLRFKDKFDRLSSPERFAVAQSKIAEKKSEILAKLEQETADLQRQKNYALTITLPELEKQLRENQIRPEPKPTHGLVTGVVYSADRPLAVVDRKIVREGDIIYGATVVKISQNSVKFSKGSRNWEQKVQQAPESYW